LRERTSGNGRVLLRIDSNTDTADTDTDFDSFRDTGTDTNTNEYAHRNADSGPDADIALCRSLFDSHSRSWYTGRDH
jgi:hypothetical protein